MSQSPNATILVVDDDRDVRDLAMACLENLGYHVLAADCGGAALELIKGAKPVDLLLIDIAMPDLRGPEVSRMVLAARPQLPVLFMTGYVGSAAPGGLTEQEILAKPFSLAELAAKVENALATRGGASIVSNIVSMKPSSRR